MNTTKACFLCAMSLAIGLAATALAQVDDRVEEKKDDVVIATSPKIVQPKSDGPNVTPTGADVTIGSGVTVTLGSDVDMSLGGNFTNSGAVTAQTGSTVDFNGTAAQTLSGNTTFSNLTKSDVGTLTVNSPVTVNNTLTLNVGSSINNGTNPINLASGATVVNNGGSTVNPPVTSGPIDVTYTNSSVITTGSELPTSATGLNNLTINGAGVTLTTSATVNGTLALTNGKITLGSNNLTLASSASVSGGSSSSHVETNGNGVFTRQGVGASPKLFPVGIGGSYNPTTITNSGTSDNFSARVQPSFTSPPAQPTKVVNRQWTVTEAVAGGSNATLQFQWNASDQASGFAPASPIVIGKHNGTQWVEQNAAVGGSNPFTATATGFTSFSPFAVGNTGAFRLVILANLKFFLEGPFNTGTNLMDNALRATVLPARFPGKPIPANAVDSVQVEIRGTPSGFTDPLPTRVTRVQVADAVSESEELGKYQPSLAEATLVDDAVSLNDLTKQIGGEELSVLPPNPKVSQPAWLLKDGTLRNFTDTTKSFIEFDTSSASNYWRIVIRHRNHLAIMTRDSILLTSTNPALYDFSTAQTQAYGTNPMKLVGTKYCMYAGDGDGSGGVNATDKILVWRVQNGLLGYLGGDFNLSGGVNATDNVLYWRLNTGFVTQVP